MPRVKRKIRRAKGQRQKPSIDNAVGVMFSRRENLISVVTDETGTKSSRFSTARPGYTYSPEGELLSKRATDRGRDLYRPADRRGADIYRAFVPPICCFLIRLRASYEPGRKRGLLLLLPAPYSDFDTTHTREIGQQDYFELFKTIVDSATEVVREADDAEVTETVVQKDFSVAGGIRRTLRPICSATS